MIKVITIKLPIKSNSFHVKENIANDLAKKISDDIKNRFSSHVCETHPSEETIISISASKNLSPISKITKFCCEDFKNSINIHITKE